MITLQNVGKTFATPEGPLRAVSGVSLQIDEGDLYGIIGFSGAGKSTLLRTINLLEKPDPGSRILVNGRDVTTLTKTELNRARQGIGMVFQQFNLLNNRTAADNVAFALEIAGVAREERRRRTAECLEIVGLTDKANTYPAKLSGGQKQRVAIARALANKPKVLLCDEPTSAVDPQTTRTILSFLKQINQQFGITIVLVTHEMSAINAVCNKVAVMENGRLIEELTLDDDTDPLPAPRSDIAKLLLHERLAAAAFAREQLNDYIPVI